MDDDIRIDAAGGGGAEVVVVVIAVSIVVAGSITVGVLWFDLVLAFTALAILAAGWIVAAAGTGRLEVASADEATGRRSPGGPDSDDGGGRLNGAPVAPAPTQPSAASAAS